MATMYPGYENSPWGIEKCNTYMKENVDNVVFFSLKVKQSLNRLAISISPNINKLGFSSIHTKRISFWPGMPEKKNLAFERII